MVKRKKTSSATEEHENGMTLGAREGIGVDGRKNSSRKPEGCDEEETGEQGNEERNTKGDGVEVLNPSTTGSPGSVPVLPAPVPNQPGPGSRIRKDSVGSAVNGHGGSKSKGAEGGSSSQGAGGQAGSAAGGGAGGVSKASRGQGPADKEEQAGNQKRARRQWESWSAEDKNSFFEGLYEHGKDFEAIQNNITIKYKKRGKPANMVKNKEQVRHFYYRTWHKISKHIDFANVYTRVLKKSSQELYGLICYAELRKKVGGRPPRYAPKKLCDPDGMSDEEDQKPVRLPLKVAVELQPRSNQSWVRVQSLAHNPRLRMMVELHRKVSSLIEYLKQKWAFHDQRILESLREREALQGASGSSTSLGGRLQPDELFLYPTECSTVTALPGVARVVHSKASCTVHWQESGKTGAKELQTAQILGIHTPTLPPRGGTKAGRGATLTATAAAADPRRADPPLALEPAAEPEEEKKALPPGTPPTSQPNSGPKVEDKQPCCGVEGQSEDTHTAPVSSLDAKPPAAVAEDSAALQLIAVAEKERLAEQIREVGWSVRGADNVTLAELYLMLGKPSKLQLEYEWQPAAPPPTASSSPGSSQASDCPTPQPRPSSTNQVLRCLLRLAATEVNPKPLTPELCSTATSPLKLPQEEQSQALTPPGKGPSATVRSPSCGRHQASLRGGKALMPNAASGGRILPRSILGPGPGTDSEGGVFAIPTTLPPNSSRHSRMFSPNKEAELAFRQQLDSISMQSDLFLSKQRKPRSRQLRKPLVVQRTLLPRTTGDTPQHVCSFSILSNSSATGTGSFRPIQTRPAPTSRPLPSKASPAASGLSRAIDLAAKSAGIIPASPSRELAASDVPGGSLLSPTDMVDEDIHTDTSLLQHNAPENGPPPSSPGVSRGSDSLLPPPSVASLLDISLPGPPEEAMTPDGPQTHISDSIIELAINSSHFDSTLGCLLSSLVSPEKGRRTSLTPSGPSSGTALLGPSLLDCNSHDSFQSRGLPDVAEMDSQLACMMSESSVDYIARFNDLAQELAVTEPSLPPPSPSQLFLANPVRPGTNPSSTTF
ncbi:hypothetical protein NHX12_032349 [Muraenolepis orangiensis]|uniref:Protein cramped-like n=1 Tax=Muraenolepis orangiensis TaxID=630683 RepID=A0A9Q0E662_9TELE|nr:hypothetical protein NHX12_032349 [Muraenolepis orangiensis]